MSKRRRQKPHEIHRVFMGNQHVSTLVDLVIPVYNRFDLLEGCLQSIPAAAAGVSYNLILVDNNSQKEDADAFYAGWNEKAIIIRNKENTGFPRACNLGASRKSSPLIFFLNTDVVLLPEAISNLVKAMDDPQVGVVGMKLLFPEHLPGNIHGKLQHIGLAADIHGDFKHLFLGWNPNHPKVMAVEDVPAVTGAAMMVRRSVWVKLGGFDPIYGLGTWEDVDFCMSASVKGFKIKVCQTAVGYHYVGATSMKYNLPYPQTQNRILFTSRWGGKFGWSEYFYL